MTYLGRVRRNATQLPNALAFHQLTNLMADRDNTRKSEEVSAHVLKWKIFPLVIKL
jgi:hypothetical protein